MKVTVPAFGEQNEMHDNIPFPHGISPHKPQCTTHLLLLPFTALLFTENQLAAGYA
jgi:hypothetical protein